MSIYFVQAGEDGPIKIGLASNVVSRVAALQTGCAQKLILLLQCKGDRDLEKSLHQKFAAHRLHGEWFRPDAEIVSEIDAIRSTQPKPAAKKREKPLTFLQILRKEIEVAPWAGAMEWFERFSRATHAVMRICGVETEAVAAMTLIAHPAAVHLACDDGASDATRKYLLACVEMFRAQPSLAFKVLVETARPHLPLEGHSLADLANLLPADDMARKLLSVPVRANTTPSRSGV